MGHPLALLRIVHLDQFCNMRSSFAGLHSHHEPGGPDKVWDGRADVQAAQQAEGGGEAGNHTSCLKCVSKVVKKYTEWGNEM